MYTTTILTLSSMNERKALNLSLIFAEYAKLPIMEDIIAVESTEFFGKTSITMKSGISIVCQNHIVANKITFDITDPMGGIWAFATFADAYDKLYEFAVEAFKENYQAKNGQLPK